MAIRVVIVDDQALIRSGLRTVLAGTEDIAVVAAAADGAEAVSVTREFRPDVVVMDLRMQRMSGLEATTHLRRLPKPPKVLVLTTFDDASTVIEALNAGASGFLLKHTPTEQLLAAVRTVAAGGTALSPDITAKLAGHASRRMPAGHRRLQEELVTMPADERDVLALIGSGMTNQQIARKLHLPSATVRTQVSRVLARLKLENRTQAAILAYEAGLVRWQG